MMPVAEVLEKPGRAAMAVKLSVPMVPTAWVTVVNVELKPALKMLKPALLVPRVA